MDGKCYLGRAGCRRPIHNDGASSFSVFVDLLSFCFVDLGTVLRQPAWRAGNEIRYDGFRLRTGQIGLPEFVDLVEKSSYKWRLIQSACDGGRVKFKNVGEFRMTIGGGKIHRNVDDYAI